MNWRRVARISGLPVLAAALLIVASTIMPWATYKDVTTDVTTTFRGGRLGLVLATFGVATVVSSPGLVTRFSTLLSRLHLVLGSAGLVVSIVLALSRISAANHVSQPGPSQTSYAFGAGVAIVASAAIAVISVVRLGGANAWGATPNVTPHSPAG